MLQILARQTMSIRRAREAWSNAMMSWAFAGRNRCFLIFFVTFLIKQKSKEDIYETYIILPFVIILRRQILDRAYPKYQVSVHTFGSKAGTRPPHPVPMNMCFMFLIILRNINWWSHCDEKKGEFIDYFSKLYLRDTKDIFVFWSMVNKVLKVPNKNRHFLYFQTNATNLSTADNVH